MSAISFFVAGQVSGQGSKRGLLRGGKIVMLDMNTNLKPWRNTIAAHATQAIHALPADQHTLYPLTGPVSLVLQADYTRPKSHYGTGRNATQLKTGAPQWKTSAPDLDKIMRALGDALTGILYADDRQIVEVSAVKWWTEDEPGLHVEVETL